LKNYDNTLLKRKEIINKYNENFNDDRVITPVHFTKNYLSAGHLYMLRIPEISEKDRAYIISQLAELGISSNVHYKPLPMLTAYKNLGFSIKDYPNAYEQYKNEITLPLYTDLSFENVEYIARNLLNILREVSDV